jgi:hypothetical protein
MRVTKTHASKVRPRRNKELARKNKPPARQVGDPVSLPKKLKLDSRGSIVAAMGV